MARVDGGEVLIPALRAEGVQALFSISDEPRVGLDDGMVRTEEWLRAEGHLRT